MNHLRRLLFRKTKRIKKLKTIVFMTSTKMLVIMTISIEMLQIVDIKTLVKVPSLSSKQTLMINKIIKLWEMIRKRYR